MGIQGWHGYLGLVWVFRVGLELGSVLPAKQSALCDCLLEAHMLGLGMLPVDKIFMATNTNSLFWPKALGRHKAASIVHHLRITERTLVTGAVAH